MWLIRLVTVLFVMTVLMHHQWCPQAVGAVKPDGAFIGAALKQQQTACGLSLQVRYTVDALVPKAGTMHEEVRYVRTPDVLFKEAKQGRLTGDGFKTEWNARFRYDRVAGVFASLHTSPSGKTNLGSVLTEADIPARFVDTELVDPSLCRTEAGALVNAVGDGSVAEAQEDVDGHKCWRVDIPERKIGTDTYGRWSIWFDPDIGFCPRRIVETLKQPTGTMVLSTDLSVYQKIADGVYFPMHLIVKYDDTGRKGMDCTVQEAVCGKAVSLDEFAVKFPSGTRVSVLDQGVSYTEP